MDVVEWLLTNRRGLDTALISELTICAAAEKGWFGVIERLHANERVLITECTVAVAACSSQIDTVKRLQPLLPGQRFSASSMHEAIRGGSYEIVLALSDDERFPCDSKSFSLAIQCMRWQILQLRV